MWTGFASAEEAAQAALPSREEVLSGRASLNEALERGLRDAPEGADAKSAEEARQRARAAELRAADPLARVQAAEEATRAEREARKLVLLERERDAAAQAVRQLQGAVSEMELLLQERERLWRRLDVALPPPQVHAGAKRPAPEPPAPHEAPETDVTPGARVVARGSEDDGGSDSDDGSRRKRAKKEKKKKDKKEKRDRRDRERGEE